MASKPKRIKIKEWQSSGGDPSPVWMTEISCSAISPFFLNFKACSRVNLVQCLTISQLALIQSFTGFRLAKTLYHSLLRHACKAHLNYFLGGISICWGRKAMMRQTSNIQVLSDLENFRSSSKLFSLASLSFRKHLHFSELPSFPIFMLFLTATLFLFSHKCTINWVQSS